LWLRTAGVSAVTSVTEIAATSDETIFSVSGRRTTRDSGGRTVLLFAAALALAVLAATIFAAAILVAFETFRTGAFFATAALLFAAAAFLAALVGADVFTA
jgi:hypothetical protein